MTSRAVALAFVMVAPLLAHRAAAQSSPAAESLYTQARAALADRQYYRAAALLAHVSEMAPHTDLAARAAYWDGYALYAAAANDSAASALGEAMATLGDAGHSNSRIAADARTLRARVVAFAADRGNAAAEQELAAAAAAVARGISCGDRDIDLEMVALERAIDRDREQAASLVASALPTDGACVATVRAVATVEVSATPGMNPSLLMASSRMATLRGGTPSAAANTDSIPPVRSLGAPLRTSTVVQLEITSIRPFDDGRVLAGSIGRVLMFDSSLTQLRPMGRGVAATWPLFPERSVITLLPFRGDSTLALALRAGEGSVLGPDGISARSLAAAHLDSQVVDAGDIAYDGIGNVFVRRPPDQHEYTHAMPAPAESSTVFRVDLGTSAWTELARLAAATGPVVGFAARGGRMSFAIMTALPSSDAWAVTPSGTVAVVRVSDYHVDWYARDGSRRSTPPIAHVWRPFSDSSRDALAKLRFPLSARGSRAAGVPGHAAVGRAMHGDTLPRLEPPFYESDAAALPMQAYAKRTVWATAEGDLWIREFRSDVNDGSSVYDVVSSTGRLVDRIRIPSDQRVAGFGRGCVYVVSRMSPGTVLSRYSIR